MGRIGVLGLTGEALCILCAIVGDILFEMMGVVGLGWWKGYCVCWTLLTGLKWAEVFDVTKEMFRISPRCLISSLCLK